MEAQQHISDATTDEELVRRCRAGCTWSFAELARRYQVLLLHFLQQRTRSRADAEDLLQDALLRAFQRLDQYAEVWSFRSWLFTIAYRLFVSWLRGQSKEVVGSGGVTWIAAPTRGNGVDEAEWRDNLWATARRVLSRTQYDIVWLRYVEGMSHEEIGRIVEHSNGSVRVQLHRARKELLPHLVPHQAAL